MMVSQRSKHATRRQRMDARTGQSHLDATPIRLPWCSVGDYHFRYLPLFDAAPDSAITTNSQRKSYPSPAAYEWQQDSLRQVQGRVGKLVLVSIGRVCESGPYGAA